MRNDDGTSGEVLKTLLQRAQRIDIHVVGRLVQKQYVTLLLERKCEVQTVAFAAGEHAALFLLVCAAEVEAGDIGAGGDLSVAESYDITVLRYHFIYALLGVDRLVLLVDISELYGLPDSEISRCRLLDAHDHAEEGGLSGTVGADDADNACGRQREIEMFVEQAVAVCLRNVVRLDDDIAQTRAVRDEYLELLLFLLHILVHQLVVGRKTCLALGVAARGRHAHPFQLAFEGLAALALLFLLHRKAFGLLLEPARIVPLPRNTLAAVELENPACDVVEEVTVVRNGNYGTFILTQVLLQPVDALGIEVVRRLVQKQHVGLLQQQAAEGHTASLASRQHLDALVGIGAPQGIHRALQNAVQLPAVDVVDLLVQLALTLDQAVHLIVRHRLAQLGVYLFVLLQQGHRCGASLLDHLLDGLRIVQLGFLLEVTDRISRGEYHLALIVLVDAGDDLHKGRLTRTVESYDTDLCAVEERQVDVVEYFFLIGEGLGYTHHRKNYFLVCHAVSCLEILKLRQKYKTKFTSPIFCAELASRRIFAGDSAGAYKLCRLQDKIIRWPEFIFSRNFAYICHQRTENRKTIY